ncbi:MAG: iron chelate uptake ABC transporter family permease subunit [Planctomycetota bacterium]
MRSMRRSTLLLIVGVAVVGQAIALQMIDAVQLRGVLGRAAATLGMEYNTFVVISGTALLGMVSGVIGSFAVLRRRALVGDAASHAALPGICIAFMFVERRDFFALMTGALISGLIGVVLINWLVRRTRLRPDAAIGIVLSVFFGLGIALSRIIQDRGAGASAGLDSFLLGKTASIIADDLFTISLIALNVLLLLVALYKEFRLISFDADFAAVQGYPVLTVDLALTGAIVITVVIGLPAVGVVLMAALLILPGVAARFWTERLGTMLLLAALFGLITGIVGTWFSVLHEKLPAGPMIVLTGSVIFLASLLVAPRRGAFARLIARIRLEQRVARQNLLRTLWLAGEGGLTLDALLALRAWTRRGALVLLERAVRDGLAEHDGTGAWRLSVAGREQGARVEAAHRVQELLLTEYTSGESDIFDRDADSLGQSLPLELLREVEARLRAEQRWPLGEGSLATT